jgi:hypothetical protein
MTTTNETNRSRHGLRAPKGGCTVNGKFYAGGQFCLPYNPADPHGLNARPASLAGSSRQVAWAFRLRKEAIARLDAQLAASRKSVKPLLAVRHRLMTETSASVFINAR